MNEGGEEEEVKGDEEGKGGVKGLKKGKDGRGGKH